MPRKKFQRHRRNPKRRKACQKSQPIIRRKCWTEESMMAALEEVKIGKYSVNRIATVPRSTLKDRVTGRVTHGTKPGPRPYLTRNEEDILAQHLVQVAKIGYGKTRKQVNMIAENVAKKEGLLKRDRISNGWLRRFLERQSDISLH